MSVLERLKELSKSGERKEGESLAEWADRFNMENAGLRNEGLPLLLELVEAVKEEKDAEEEFWLAHTFAYQTKDDAITALNRASKRIETARCNTKAVLDRLEGVE